MIKNTIQNNNNNYIIMKDADSSNNSIMRIDTDPFDNDNFKTKMILNSPSPIKEN